MKTLTAYVPWKSPYGEASWVNTPVLYNDKVIGQVIEEEAGGRRTALVTVKYDENSIPFPFEDCDLISHSVLELDPFEEVEYDPALVSPQFEEVDDEFECIDPQDTLL